MTPTVVPGREDIMIRDEAVTVKLPPRVAGKVVTPVKRKIFVIKKEES